MKKLTILAGIIVLIALETVLAYELAYKERIYPGVSVQGVGLGRWQKKEVADFFEAQNKAFYQTQFVFSFEEKTATVSGSQIKWGYHPEAIAKRAYQVGRSGNFFLNERTKLKLFFQGLDLEPIYDFDQERLRSLLSAFEKEVYRPPENALFQFKGGRVVAFQKEREGRELDIKKAILEIEKRLGESPALVKIELSSRVIKPEVTMEEANNLGISEFLGEGISYFGGSSTPRIHNIILATSRLNGLLIRPQAIFSFNQALGDVSGQSGYREAYVIKEGRTILDDGGGVCQVSTTLFRAALATGLPIIERHPHSYRVSYYEQGGFGPGLDATIYYPSVDLKFKNDTPAYILIQASVDTKTKTLTFKVYGASDGRQAVISQPKVWEQTPPPEDLYQDEPSLPKGEVKQIERKAWGAKVSLDWKVERNGESLHQKRFWSHYQPWQAIYLRGTGE